MTPFGRFKLEQKLATGGMAEVWLAHDDGSHQVVVKRVLPHLASNQRFNDMLMNEARVLMYLNHPNIVRVYEVGKLEDLAFISMEYVPGSDLAVLLKRAAKKKLKVPLAIALRIARSLAEALEAVHMAVNEKGRPLNLVHRDISPHNVMVGRDGVTKLLDFGVVKAFNELELTDPGTIKGKFAYMSPEQATGRPLDGRSDVFAAGLVTYELLTGLRAYRRDNEAATYQAALTADVAPMSSVWFRAPAELAAVISKALAADPDERFQSAFDFAGALASCDEAAEQAEVAAWAESLDEPAKELFALGEGKVEPTAAGLTVAARPSAKLAPSVAVRMPGGPALSPPNAGAGALHEDGSEPLELPPDPGEKPPKSAKARTNSQRSGSAKLPAALPPASTPALPRLSAAKPASTGGDFSDQPTVRYDSSSLERPAQPQPTGARPPRSDQAPASRGLTGAPSTGRAPSRIQSAGAAGSESEEGRGDEELSGHDQDGDSSSDEDTTLDGVAAPSQRIGQIELAKAPSGETSSLDVPQETRLSLPSEPIELMSTAASAPSALSERFDSAEERPRQPPAEFDLRMHSAGSFLWPGLIAIAIGLLAGVAAVKDPLDALGQWAAPIGAALFVVLGAFSATRIFDRREALVALPAAAALLGIARGDPLMALGAATLASGLWLATDEDDDRELQRWFGRLLTVPALVLAALGFFGAFLSKAPLADGLSMFRRQGNAEVTESIALGEVMSFQAPGWRLRPATDVADALELTLPAYRATIVARLMKLDSARPGYEDMLRQATADFGKRGWTDLVVAENDELVDEADESHLIGFRLRRGLTWSTGLIRMARVDDQLCVLVATAGERRMDLVRDTLLAVARSMRCKPAGANVVLEAEVLATARKSLVTLRAGERVELGVIIEQRDGQVMILADDALLGEATPPALSFRPLLTPGDQLRRATVLRRKPGVLILMAEADQALVPMPLVAAPASDFDGHIITLGLADDAASSRLHMRPGQLSNRALTFDPHVNHSSGPVMTAGGKLLGLLRAGEGPRRAATTLADVEPMLDPAIRHIAWRIDLDSTHQCAVSVRADFDDPFHEIGSVRLVLGAPHDEKEMREVMLAGNASVTLTETLDCPPEPVLSIGVKAASGKVLKLVDSTPMPSEFPSSRRGQRSDSTRPGENDIQLLSWLFQVPAPRAPACTNEDCTRACSMGSGEACLVLGNTLFNAGRPGLAINDYERGCVAKSFESCIQVAHLAGPKTIDTFTAVLKPWCEAGVKRACVALKASEFREQLKRENDDCSKNREACLREAMLLLDGPRRTADVQRARNVLERRCSEGVVQTCLRSGLEYLRSGNAAQAFDALNRGCKAGSAEACVESAGLAAIGANGPRNVESAARLLKTTCELGDAAACSAIAKAAAAKQ